MSESTQTEPTQPEKAGRYNRSTGGLIGSMIVLVLAVLAIVAFRGTFRDTPDYEPDHIDYLELVTSVQQTGLTPLYPPELPDGWYVKDASFVPGDRPSLDLVFTTDDEHTAGLHQEDTGERELLTKYVGAGATEDDDAELDDRRRDLDRVGRHRRRPRLHRRARRRHRAGLQLGRPRRPAELRRVADRRSAHPVGRVGTSDA